jgi:hypothetical protein
VRSRTDPPPALSPRQLVRDLERQVLASAVEYGLHSEGGGEHPHLSAARYKLAAKAYTAALRAAGMLP